MIDIQDKLDPTLGSVEKFFNFAGYVPLVSSISGALRINYGKIEVIGGIVAGAIVAVAALFQGTDSERRQGLDRAFEVLTTYTLHGLANIFRGAIEVVPLLSLVTCLPYDLLGNRFSYPRENGSAPEIWTLPCAPVR